jgi:hypothetical protein
VPFQYDVDHAAQLVTILWRNPISVPEMIEVLERQAADGAWKYGVLHDMRQATSAPLSASNPAYEVSRRLSNVHGPRGPIALVPSLDQVGASQMFVIKAREEQRMQVFWSRDDAVRWLKSGSTTDRSALL